MTAEPPFAEHDVVALRVPTGAWPAGTKGAVVSVYWDAVLVEIADADGRTRDTLTIPTGLLARPAR